MSEMDYTNQDDKNRVNVIIKTRGEGASDYDDTYVVAYVFDDDTTPEEARDTTSEIVLNGINDNKFIILDHVLNKMGYSNKRFWVRTKDIYYVDVNVLEYTFTKRS